MTSPSEDALNELFNRPPLLLTDNDISRIVDALRSQRAKWLIEETAPKKAPKTKTPKTKITQEALSLDDLLE